jgi:hypothetical protein
MHLPSWYEASSGAVCTHAAAAGFVTVWQRPLLASQTSIKSSSQCSSAAVAVQAKDAAT